MNIHGWSHHKVSKGCDTCSQTSDNDWSNKTLMVLILAVTHLFAGQLHCHNYVIYVIATIYLQGERNYQLNSYYSLCQWPWHWTISISSKPMLVQYQALVYSKSISYTGVHTKQIHIIKCKLTLNKLPNETVVHLCNIYMKSYPGNHMRV